MSEYISDIYSDKAYCWLMFIKNNNLAFLKKDSLNKSPNKVGFEVDEDAIAAYEEINDQIIAEFGQNESFLAHKELQRNVAILKLDFIISGNKMKRTEWRIRELELKGKESSTEDLDMSVSKEVAIVSKNLGAGIIDIKDYTIFQYLTAKNNIDVKQQNKYPAIN